MPEQFSPLRLFIILLVLIFCIEGTMMLALDHMVPKGTPVWVEAVIDAGVLTALTSVFVWRLFMRPLRFALMSEVVQAKAVTNSAAEGIITIDERGIIRSVNPAAERMFAYESRELVGKNVKLLMPEPHKGAHDDYLSRYARTGEARIIGRPKELAALRKDGTELPIELNVTEIRLGGARRFVGIVRDITERKLTEQSLREGEEKLRVIADSLPALVSYVDANQVYQFANSTYENWFGLNRKDIVGRTMRDVLGDASYVVAEPYIREALAGREAAHERELIRNGKSHQLYNVYVPHIGSRKDVLGFFILATDISDRKTLEHRLVHLAHHDSLTGLPNRMLFEDRLRQAMERSKRYRKPVSLMYLDIDHFKSINDNFGHNVGDELLKAFAARIKQCVRAMDTVARLGGDEFVIILEELATPEDVAMVARKIVNSMQIEFRLTDRNLRITTSIGVATCSGGHVDNQKLMANADAALYQAKAKGRNTFHIGALR